MHTYIYIQYLCGGEKTKGDPLHLKRLSGGSHLRLLSQQHLRALGVRALMGLNKMAAAVRLLDPALRGRHLGREVAKVSVSHSRVSSFNGSGYFPSVFSGIEIPVTCT